MTKTDLMILVAAIGGLGVVFLFFWLITPGANGRRRKRAAALPAGSSRAEAGGALAHAAGMVIFGAALLPWSSYVGEGWPHLREAPRWMLLVGGAVMTALAAFRVRGPVWVVWGLVAVVTTVVCWKGFGAAKQWVPEGRLTVGKGPYVGLVGAAMAVIAAISQLRGRRDHDDQ